MRFGLKKILALAGGANRLGKDREIVIIVKLLLNAVRANRTVLIINLIRIVRAIELELARRALVITARIRRLGQAKEGGTSTRSTEGGRSTTRAVLANVDGRTGNVVTVRDKSVLLEIGVGHRVLEVLETFLPLLQITLAKLQPHNDQSQDHNRI
jgi:hypothetical protein